MMNGHSGVWARQRLLSRRRLLQSAAGAGAIGGLSLLACSSGRRGAPAASGPSGQTAAKRGGVLRIGLTSDPGTLDLQQETVVEGLFVLMPLYSQVLRQVPNDWGKLEGDLATKLEPSSDGSKWTFTIRQDVKWHDGKPLTVDDIVYSLNRMVNPPPGYKGGNGGNLRGVVASVTAQDPQSFVVQLKRPAISFLQAIANPYIRILPKHILEPIDQNEKSRSLKPAELIGSGPFRFKSYERGSTFVYERNPDYYMKGQPYLDGLTYYYIPDDNTKLDSIRTGRLDLLGLSATWKASQANQTQAAAPDKLVVKTGSNARFIGLFFNTSVAPFQDVRLRRAVHLALNRQQMIQLIQEGQGTITPFLDSFDSVYPIDHYLQLPGYRADKSADMAQAKQLVDAATGGKGLDTTFSVITTTYPDVVQLERQQLASIGIRVQLQTFESAVAEARYNAGQDIVIGAHPCAVPFNDPDSMIARYFLPSGERFWSKWQNQQLIDLYAKESVDVDQTSRTKSLQLIADLLEQELPAIGLTDALRIMIVAKTIRGLEVLPPSVNADWRFDWLSLS
jgi:peptide/nickel transport system substrate-binding protein